jgi:hypothetical protein
VFFEFVDSVRDVIDSLNFKISGRASEEIFESASNVMCHKLAVGESEVEERGSGCHGPEVIVSLGRPKGRNTQLTTREFNSELFGRREPDSQKVIADLIAKPSGARMEVNDHLIPE